MLKKLFADLPPLVKGAILLGGGFIVYRGIKKIINQPDPIKLPQGGAGLPVVGNTTTGAPVFWNPATLSKDLHAVMSGLFTLSGTKDQVWTKLGELPSGDMVTAVYNHFNTNYGEGETLTDWIKAELWYDITGSGKDLALARLASLNLS